MIPWVHSTAPATKHNSGKALWDKKMRYYIEDMSLIFGINLSDRIYLSGDTRLTQKQGDVIKEIKDRIIKVTPFTDDIAAVFAGDAKMSAFVSQKLAEMIKPGVDIRTLRTNIETFLAPTVSEYWENKEAKASMAVIFGGLNRTTKKKPITAKQIYDLAMVQSKANPGNSFNLKPELFNSIARQMGQPLRYPEASDSHVFSVQVYPPNILTIQDADWGEYLAYGAGGITKNKLDPSVVSRIEFGGAEGQDNAMIAAILGDVVYRTQEPTIGGTFFTHVIHDNVSGAVLGRIFRININTMQEEIVSEVAITDGKLYGRCADGTMELLTLLHQYKDFGDLNL